MTLSKAARSMLTFLARTLGRIWKRNAISLTLTVSIPPFIKLEIKTEPHRPKNADR
ncbi:MAG: hypothetical protein ABF537_07925 [Acetobacter sp.]|uniref:hypothetical protein n=1 Tax=Acetobacter sp. TaxID=440 RepID=UPI0039EC4D45